MYFLDANVIIYLISKPDIYISLFWIPVFYRYNITVQTKNTGKR